MRSEAYAVWNAVFGQNQSLSEMGPRSMSYFVSRVSKMKLSRICQRSGIPQPQRDR